MYALVNGALNGDYSKATMWIGCTGCGPYRNDTISYDGNEPLDFGEGKGFDAFARDILILKHFRLPSVSIFLASERFDPDSTDKSGFFDQYGYEDSLDRLNETVNGHNSTQSFTIKAYGDFLPDRSIIKDFMLNFNQFIYILVMIGYFTLGIIVAKFEKIKKRLAKTSGNI